MVGATSCKAALERCDALGEVIADKEREKFIAMPQELPSKVAVESERGPKNPNPKEMLPKIPNRKTNVRTPEQDRPWARSDRLDLAYKGKKQ